MLAKLKSIIALAFASLVCLQTAVATEAVSPTSQMAGGNGRITRIQSAPSVIVVDNAEYSLPLSTVVLGPDKSPISIDKLDVGMAVRFTIQQPSTTGDRPVITSIRILAD